METFAFLLSLYSHTPQPPTWPSFLLLFKGITSGKSDAPLPALSSPSRCSLACVLYRHGAIKHTPVPTPIFQGPWPLMDHPTALLDGLVAPVPLGRMTQRRHYANRCLSGALPPYCCCCHKDQLRTVYINLNAPWGWGCKTKQHRPWKSCRCAEEED